MTVIGYDDFFLQHRPAQHPERPARLTSIQEKLKREGVWSALTMVTNRVEPDAWIETIHTEEYIERLRSACENGLPFIDHPDSAISSDSYQAARKAIAVTLAAADMVMQGEAENAFCMVRPPGHHAEPDRSLGFCMFNNAAVLARYLQRQHGLKRILILDFDVHHGNGTQHSFEKDNTVFYGSIHQHPATCFPGTGWPNEFGKGQGRGYTLNIPLAPGAGDDDFLEAFEVNFLPMARDFQPNFVLLSAGFDGHRKDPLAQWELTEESFRILTRKMKDFAQQYCNGRMVSLLEGGYHLGALSDSVAAHIQCLMEPVEIGGKQE